MSAPPGRQRSLGASLLDQVLAETLDPAYAQAAAARAARAADLRPDPDPDRGAAPGRPPWLRRHRGQLLVALTLLIAGLLASITYSEAAAGAEGREQARQALREDIRTESDNADELVVQLEELTAEVTSTRQRALEASSVGQRALDELAAAEQGAATVAVSGPGLRVTMDNAPPEADSDPVGGSAEVAEPGIVQDNDLRRLVNGLWAAGAEAISLNGQRIGATTTIRQAGGAILVDLRPVAAPYVLSAVGDPQGLQNAFLTTPEARDLGQLTPDYGVVFEVGRADDLELPAATAAELRHAAPLAATAPARGSGTTPGAVPDTPDPTSDGD
ncbi:DUF881 domain-containing protein [Modestobacter versicolor]|uniref:DUF881 domain-containing protein n=1 Tax=Modestobacter versicolor TaxID=429133 RepID=UPI0034DE371C